MPPALTVMERIALLRPMPTRQAAHVAWLTDAMLSTEGGRQRLRAWTAAGCPPAPDPAQIAFLGDPRLRRIVEQAVSRIPPPPVRWALQDLLFIGVGASSRAWCGNYPAFPLDGRSAPAIVAIGGDVHDDEEGLAIVAHEVAHAWLRDVCAAPVPVDRFRDPAPPIGDLVIEWRIPAAHVHTLLAPHRLTEWRAARLAQAWGFTGFAADPDRAARAARLDHT